MIFVLFYCPILYELFSFVLCSYWCHGKTMFRPVLGAIFSVIAFSFIIIIIIIIFFFFQKMSSTLSSIELHSVCCLQMSLTLSQTTNFRLVQIETVCRRLFKFNENSRKFSKWVENTVSKGEIARYEQFLFFPQRFHKACFPGASKGVIVWEWVNLLKSKILVF